MKITNIAVVLSALAFLPLRMIGQENQAQNTKALAPASNQRTNDEGEPQSADEAYRRAMRFIQTHQVDEAISMFSKAVLLKPDWAEAFAARGRALSEAKRYAEAIEDFDKAIRLDSEHPGWYNIRGLVYEKLGQQSKAIENYTRAIELSPTTAAYYNNRGLAYNKIGQFENAIADLSRTIQLAPSVVKAYENRAAVYERVKDWSHAIADYSAAIQIAPSAWQYQRRAEAKLAVGDQAGAEEDRRKGGAQEAIPNSAVPSAYQIVNGIAPPRISVKVEPQYSEEARLAGLEGTVAVFVVVDSEGRPGDLRVVRSLGLGLDEKAIEAVSQWKFLPGTKDGQAVPVQATIEVNFRFGDKKTGWHLAEISFQPLLGDSRPHLVSAKRPSLPDSGESASITVSFDVDEFGVPANLQVDKSTDPKWERNTVGAVQAWKFSPGYKDGRAVSTHCTLSFVIDGSVPK